MRTCYIHLGTHKTGTTSIQMTLGRHAEVLARSGYLYPLTCRPDDAPAQHNVAFSLRDDPRFRRSNGTIEELLEEIKTSSLDIILSSEEFSHALHYEPKKFQELVDQIASLCPRIVILIYLRRQIDYIRSNYFERLKSGFALTFEDYAMQRLEFELSEFPLDYSKLISAIDNLKGVEAIVRSYDAVRNGRVVSDFLQVVGLPPSEFDIDAGVNLEQSLAESFGRYYQNRMGRPATGAEQDIINAIVPALSAAKLRMADSTRAVVTQRFRKSNEEIATRFGLPDLTSDPPPPVEPAFIIDHIFSAELPIAIKALAGFSDEPGASDSVFAVAQRLAMKRLHGAEAVQERLDRTDAALAKAQSLAIERFHEIKALQARLDITDAALSEAQSLAIERFQEIKRLEERVIAADGDSR
jgi:hypothetical protein